MVVPNNYYTSENPHSDIIEGSKELPGKVTPQNIVRNDDVSENVSKCENTSLGIIEMDDKQRYNCLADNSKFETKQQMSNSNIEQEPKENIKIFACSICIKSFPKYHRLKTHMRSHTNEKPFICFFCSKPFLAKSDLTRHMRIHTGEKTYILLRYLQQDVCAK